MKNHMKKARILNGQMALAFVLIALTGCTAILDLTQCERDEDCSSGVCTEEGLCVVESECEGEECESPKVCENDEECDEDGEVCDQETNLCVIPEVVACELDEECPEAEICTGGTCMAGERCDQLGGFLELVWSDFETAEFTNVEGFRNPLNVQTVAEDVEGEGLNGGTVLRLSYDLSDGEGVTGYRMYAFPSADTTGSEELVIRARADREIEGVQVRILDTDGVRGEEGESFSTFSVEPGWREIRLPLDEFLLPDGNGSYPNVESWQLIEILFGRGSTTAEVGVVELDFVGLRSKPPSLPVVQEDAGLVWCDFGIDGFTNVEGFRQPLNEAMRARDGVEGPQGEPAMEMIFNAAETGRTGYRLFAFPAADVSSFDAFYMVLRGSERVLNMRVEFYDEAELETRGSGGWASTEVAVGTGWEVLWFPLDSLVPQGTNGVIPDWESLQLVNLIFREGETCPESGRIVISEVGFMNRSAAE